MMLQKFKSIITAQSNVRHCRYKLSISHNITPSPFIMTISFNNKMNTAFPFDVKYLFPASLICIIYRLKFSASWIKLFVQ